MTAIVADLRSAWHRHPAVFRTPDWAQWATPDLVREGLAQAAMNTGASWRLFSGEQIVKRDELDALPRGDEGTLSSYLARLGRAHAQPGLIVNQFQATSTRCWVAVTTLVAQLYEAFGSSHGGALVDLFLSGPSESFFGAHKDDQDVFMFVAAGKKRIELWTYDSLAPSYGKPGYYTPKHLGQVAVERPPDLVLEARAGDVIYWPAGYWHRVHNLDELTVGLSLGLFTRPDPLALLARLSELDVVSSPRHLDHPLQRRILAPSGNAELELDEMLTSLARATDSRGRLREALLSFKSSLGFRATPRVPRPPSVEGSQFRCATGALIEIIEQPQALLLGVAGRLVRYPNDLGLLTVLEQLRSGEPTNLDTLEARALARDPSWSQFSPAERRALLDKLVCDLIEVCALVECGQLGLRRVA